MTDLQHIESITEGGTTMKAQTSFGERELPVHLADSEPDSGWLFHFGDTQVAILGCGLSLEDALEGAFEWLGDHAPGLLCTPDYEGAAKELGIAWGNDMTDDEHDRVSLAAEVDLTMCDHTVLKNGSAIPSWEWSCHELSDSEVAELTPEAES